MPPDRIEDRIELRADVAAVDRERDIAGHIERDVVAHAGDTHTGAFELLAQLHFLLVHVVTNAAARQRTNAAHDQGALFPFAGVVTTDQPNSVTGRCTDRRPLGGITGLLFSGVWIQGGASGQNAQKSCEESNKEPGFRHVCFPGVKPVYGEVKGFQYHSPLSSIPRLF